MSLVYSAQIEQISVGFNERGSVYGLELKRVKLVRGSRKMSQSVVYVCQLIHYLANFAQSLMSRYTARKYRARKEGPTRANRRPTGQGPTQWAIL